MQKKIVAFFIAGVMACSALAGCGGKESSGLSDKNIEIRQYKGVVVEEVKPQKITDEIVDQQIAQLISNPEFYVSKDKVVERTNIAVIDFTGKKDGEAFEGGSGKDYPLLIGSGTFIPGFEEQLLGKKKGDKVEVKVKFPEDYQQKDLAGQDVVFDVDIKDVKVQPKFDDKIVKEVAPKMDFKAKTVKDFKAELKDVLKKNEKERSEAMLKDASWKAFMDNVKVKNYPKDSLKEEQKTYKDMYKKMAKENDMSLEDFLKQNMNGMTEKAFDKELEKISEQTLKQKMACDLVANKEKLNVSEADYQKKLKKYAKDYGYEKPADLEKEVGKKLLKQDMLVENVKTFVADNAEQLPAKEYQKYVKEHEKKSDNKKADKKK